MSTVIKIENLSKEYRLGVIGHGTLYRDLQSWWAKARGKPDPNSLLGMANPTQGKDRILALNKIDLEVNDGEVLGIIGANGAGKSTLLKILSKVTAPTTGTIKYKGRVASLLEVGTGFHNELTGRENIFLNGAINGMKKKEVKSKLDEIVDFAGVEHFLDTPVKRYSSGMYVRLGFAVAAHLDPDILVVDEVLAVGDAEFQKKAISKMQNVGKDEGRTVLFVSHNMESIKSLCPRAVLLKEGKSIEDGPTKDVINSYLSVSYDDINKLAGEITWGLENAPGNDVVRLVAIRTRNKNGEICSSFDVTDQIIVEVECHILKTGYQLYGNIEFIDLFHNKVLFGVTDSYVRGQWGKQPTLEAGIWRTKYYVQENLLQPGNISINVSVSMAPQAMNFSWQIREIQVFSFEIVDSMNSEGTRGSYPYEWWDSPVRPKIKSTSEHLDK